MNGYEQLKVSCIRKCMASKGKLEERLVCQGTTEYAILVGVLVVIAIIAILAFKDKLQNLWDEIANNINKL